MGESAVADHSALIEALIELRRARAEQRAHREEQRAHHACIHARLVELGAAVGRLRRAVEAIVGAPPSPDEGARPCGPLH
jgi:hypothetical protein